MEGYKTDVLFTKCEREVLIRVVHGYSLKETAERLCVVYQCVANHLQVIYDKAGIFDHRTLNALTSWWFCQNFNITFNLSDLTRKIGAATLLCLFSVELLNFSMECRVLRAPRRGRRDEIELIA